MKMSEGITQHTVPYIWPDGSGVTDEVPYIADPITPGSDP